MAPRIPHTVIIILAAVCTASRLVVPTSASSTASNTTRVGATSASWSFPVTSNVLSSATSSYLQNHASAYTPPRKSLSSQTFPHNYYTTPPTVTASPATYSPPYNPLDYYLNGDYKASSAIGTTRPPVTYSMPPSTKYYASDYGDDSAEDSRERYVSRTDRPASGPTYVRTKYGYASKNPLLADEQQKTSSEDGKQKVSGSEKHYVTSSSELYGYKGYDYPDLNYPDYDGHPYPPGHHHRYKHGARGPLALLLGLLPLGLLMAAMVPSFVNLPVAATVGATVGGAGRRRRSVEHGGDVLQTLLKNLDDFDCLQRVFCNAVTRSDTPGAQIVREVFLQLTTLLHDDWPKSFQPLITSIERRKCEVFKCKDTGGKVKTVTQGQRKTHSPNRNNRL